MNRPVLRPGGLVFGPDFIDEKSLTNRKSLNVALLGALSHHLDIPESHWLEAVRAALPERLRVLLALYYDEELTYREIAKILGVSEPRVCQLHAEAVKKLRATLTEDEG